jgi:site-specific DNA recombinase
MGVQNMSTYDANLVKTIAAAFAWFDGIISGQIFSLQDLASREGLPASEVSRLLPLAFLPPAVIAAILAGRQPPQLTAERLKRLSKLPLAWIEQRASLGFPQGP